MTVFRASNFIPMLKVNVVIVLSIKYSGQKQKLSLKFFEIFRFLFRTDYFRSALQLEAKMASDDY